MPSTYSNYGGTTGPRYRLYIDYSEDNVNNSANTSRANATIRMYTTNSYGWYNFLSPGGYLRIDGTQWNFGGNYDSRPSGPAKTVATFTSQSKTITHNNDGTKSINIAGYHNADVSLSGQSLTSASRSFTFTLTTIPRYANITSYTRDNINDVGFRLGVDPDATCNLYQYSLNGGGWTTFYSGSSSAKKYVTFSTLASDTTYTIRARVRRSDSGLYTYTSTQNVTTASQNNFIGFM